MELSCNRHQATEHLKSLNVFSEFISINYLLHTFKLLQLNCEYEAEPVEFSKRKTASLNIQMTGRRNYQNGYIEGHFAPREQGNIQNGMLSSLFTYYFGQYY